MKAALILMALCLTGCCADFVALDQLPTFGDQLPGTIHVIARTGFKRPGHYYLPEGATLGLLIDVAGWKPVKQEHETLLNGGRYTWHFLLVKKHHQNPKGRARSEEIISWLDTSGMPYQHRERPLMDGDWVILSGFAF